MNKAKLRTYAPQARKDFIAAVTARANQLGLSSEAGGFTVAPATRQGDVTLINGRDWPAKVYGQRESLIKRMQRDGFGQTIEAVAYTWFNRFAALRYMELHDYLEHGYRVLSSSTPTEGAAHTPDILLHAVDLAENRNLPGLSSEQVNRLKLAGNKDGELYRLLLVAQCNALSAAMPFLFEHIDDETELLLPDNLLRTDSVIAKLVAEIPEEDWAEVEIIGWLYQFYISEKKDQVIGKVVKSEDIPAATQLFTPNWIVQYLVQNSVGRLWLMANPASTLKSEWPYYIEPAEQTPEVNAQLDALIQTRMAEDGGSLNPESITVLDPACGSGHILVEAYALLKGIYLERGYRLRDIPRLILEKNLYGLDIDDRAAQLAGFALLMKARADDRRLFNDPPRLKVLSLQESKGLDLDELATHLTPFGVQRGTVKALLDTFEHAKTFGSLIQIPDALNAQLPSLAEALGKANETGDLYAQAAAQDLMALVEQAKVLGRKFDAVVANPPYMGGKSFNDALRSFVRRNYAGFDRDLFAAFIIRQGTLTKENGFIGVMTSFTWMFISSFEKLRNDAINHRTISTLIQLEYDAFEDAKAHVCTFTMQGIYVKDYVAAFIRLTSFKGAENQGPRTLQAIRNPNCGWMHFAKVDSFAGVPGMPLVYWLSANAISLFTNSTPLGELVIPAQGSTLGENDKFLRFWYEINSRERANWKTCLKGGQFRRWYGNRLHVVLWKENGKAIREFPRATLRNAQHMNKPGIEWSRITSIANSFRAFSDGEFIESGAGSIYVTEKSEEILGLLNSKVTQYFLEALSPTVTCQTGDLISIPYRPTGTTIKTNECVDIARFDWDAYETSNDFSYFFLVMKSNLCRTIFTSWQSWDGDCRRRIERLQSLETANNDIFIRAYGLQNELSPEVSEDQITLTRADREKDSLRLISYAIGCMMGRYSLDEPGLIYAHAGNVGFDATRYQTFPADADGIVPITDEFWFEDDAANRVREFLRAVWGANTLDENMAWLAESLGTKANETPDETIRRYLADKFFKDHLQTYKKRPIYWLFSSGKQGAFQALVYLHRYHEGTLARLRAEYVVPLTGKLQARIDMLEKDAESASTATRNKINKQIEKLRKKHVELLAYDEKLRHHADLRISLDLDDGVKVNYGKFGDLLAEVKAVTGGKDEE